jgi:hypothetical protein
VPVTHTIVQSVEINMEQLLSNVEL